jgi:hypothetical protein
MTTPSDRRGWLMKHSSLLRAGSQFRKKAQRYHNPILSNALAARCARVSAERTREDAYPSMEGIPPIC